MCRPGRATSRKARLLRCVEGVTLEVKRFHYREISRVHLLEPTSNLRTRKFAWIPPVYANRCIFARNDKELVCASLAATP